MSIQDRRVRSLVVTNMWPTPAVPGTGTFVRDRVESLRAAGVDVEVMYFPRTEGRSVYRGLGRKVAAAAAERQPDVVHVMYGGVMADAVTRSVFGRPVVVSFCGSDLLGGRGASLAERLSLRYGVLASRRAARRAAGVIVMSRNLHDALPAVVSRDRTWIVPDGVDFSRFRPLDRARCRAELGWEGDRRHVLFPALRSRPEKRYALAEATVEALNAEGHAVELHALENVPHAEVPVWLNAANAVLLTSAHEGSTNVVKEALACDVAVVSVDVGDARERLAGIEGCFVADAAPEDLAAKLSAALANGERVAGRASIRDLALDRTAARVAEIYREVIDGGGGEALLRRA